MVGLVGVKFYLSLSHGDRQTDRQRQTQTEADRQTKRETEIDTQKQTKRRALRVILKSKYALKSLKSIHVGLPVKCYILPQ
jgi:beta-lactamase class A